MNQKLIEIVGKELKLLRTDKDLSLEEASSIITIKQQTLSQYENAKTNMSLDKLDEILTSYGVDKFIFFKKVCERYSQSDKGE